VLSHTPWRVHLNRQRISRVPQRYSYSLMRYDSIGFASWNISGIASVLNYEISNYQYSNEELIQVEDCTIGKETQPDTEKETQKPHDPPRCKITRECSSGKSPMKKKTNKKKQKNRKKNSRTSPQAGAPASPSQVVPERAPQQELKKAVAKPSHLLTALKIRKAVHTNL